MIWVKLESKKFPVRARKLQSFMQQMANRIVVGSYRHEKGKDNFGHRSQDYHKRLKKCLRDYETTGNLEKLLDVANYAALEFYNSNHPLQHFNEKDSQGKTQLNQEFV